MLEPCSADTTQHCYCSRRNTCIHDEMECICERLRTCEERMLTTYLARDNFEAGLDAARKAVGNIAERWDHWEGERRISMEIDGQFIDRDDALAAIDALREKNP